LCVEQQGQTALSIAQKLGYISVVETLKVVTETTITTTTTTIVEEKYRVMAPETMQETFMSDSEDEGGKWPLFISSRHIFTFCVDFQYFLLLLGLTNS
jgi:ankyrin